MKLNLEQRIWLQNYELAKTNGGMYENDLGFVPLDEIAIPDWYEDYLYEEQALAENKSVAPQSPMVAGSLRKAEELWAGSGKATEQDSESTIEDPVVNEGSTPSQSTNFAAELGRRGGEVTKLRGSEYYSKIAKLSWEKRRSATGT